MTDHSPRSSSTARGRAARIDIGALLDVDRIIQSLDLITENEADQGLVAVVLVHPDVSGRLFGIDDADFIGWAGPFQSRLMAADSRLRLAFRSADELVGFVPGLSSRREVGPLVDRLARALHGPMTLGAGSVDVDSRAGVAVVDQNNPDSESAMGAARLALDRTTVSCRARGFRPFQRLRQAGQGALESRVRHDLAAGEVRVSYQPIVDLRDGSVRGVEALARLADGRRGELAPGVFLPIAARHGLMSHVGAGVLARVSADVARWRTTVGSPLTVWINLSVTEVLDVDTMGPVTALAGAHPLVDVGVELTDTGRASVDQIRRAAEQLAAYELPTAVDYHAIPFTELARNRFHTVKLNRRLLRHIAARSADATGALVTMLHELDLLVTGEGIETEGHLRPVVRAGCDLGQGFYFARPVEPELIDRLLADNGASALRTDVGAQTSTPAPSSALTSSRP